MSAYRVCPSELHSLPSPLPTPVRGGDGLFGRGLTVQSRVPCKGCGRNETDTGPLETSENFPVTVCKRSYRKNNGGWHLNYMEEQRREKGRPAQGRAESGRELESERKNPVLSAFRSKGASQGTQWMVRHRQQLHRAWREEALFGLTDKIYLLLRLNAVGRESNCRTQKPRKDAVSDTDEPGAPLSPPPPPFLVHMFC